MPEEALPRRVFFLESETGHDFASSQFGWGPHSPLAYSFILSCLASQQAAWYVNTFLQYMLFEPISILPVGHSELQLPLLCVYQPQDGSVAVAGQQKVRCPALPQPVSSIISSFFLEPLSVRLTGTYLS